MKNFKSLTNTRAPLLAALLVGTLGLSACASIGYRCPLDQDGDAESPTACASMQDAMFGARKGTGGKTSALMDDQGRLVPRELLENKVAKPLTTQGNEPYRAKSGDPVFHQPKVFQVWTGAFVDAEGNLHDGHTSWFSTPGRWAYGTVDQPSVAGNNTLRPAVPDSRPTGRILTTDQGRQEGQQSQKSAAPDATASAQKERDKAALQALSNAASTATTPSSAKTQAQPAPDKPVPTANSVTAPAVGLGD